MLRFVRYNIRKRFFLDTSGITIALFVIMLCTLTPLRAQQSSTLFCNTQDLGKEFDYRGQSTYTKLSPGDTCKVQAILYSGNKIRIMTCSDPRFGLIQLKVFKTVREYKRIVEKIEKKESFDNNKTESIYDSTIEEQMKKLDSIQTGDVVYHKKFGSGKVLSVDKKGKYIKVSFNDGEKKFVFPDAFLQNHLKFE